MKTIDRSRLKSLMEREQKKFVDERPKSKALFERARKSLLAGVPMNWMVKWAGAFPPFVREAQGAHYLQICGIFQRHAHLQMPELRAFVRIDGIDPNGSVSLTPELRDAIIQRAEAFLRGTE
jgi:hypothetical protein